MHILLTNDDGIFAPGLAAMYKQLTKIATVSVVAPAQVQSGASQSITLTPLMCDKIDIAGKFTGFSVEGSPVDCVKLAVMKLVKEPIDLVVSGINYGANAGVHVHYSGTVGAAMEGAFFGLPAIAVSAAYRDEVDFDKAAEHALEIIKKLQPVGAAKVINVNIPALSEGEPKGVKVVPHSTNSYEENYKLGKNGNGDIVYLYAGGKHRDKGRETDTTALLDGYITVTALHFDLTDVTENESLGKIEW